MVEDVDGNRYIDWMAGIAVSSTGYNHPKVVDRRPGGGRPFLHICGTDFYYEGFAELCEKLSGSAPMEGKVPRVPDQLRHRGRRGRRQARRRHTPSATA